MREPEMQAVDSSTIEAVGYESGKREIYIRFLDGGTYAYSDTDESICKELLSADSIGGYFNRVIKHNYSCRPL